MASAPIKTPLVGVMRFTMPLAVAYAVITRSLPTPAKSAIGAIIGIERAARPEVEGTRNERSAKKTKEITEKASEAKSIMLDKHAEPNVTGGLYNSFRYKWFDLSFLFNYQFGGWSYDTWAQKT